MKRSFLWMAVPLILAFAATESPGGSYTVTTTPEQDEALKVMATKRHVPGTSAITEQQLIQQVMDSYTRNTVVDIRRAAACAKVTDPQAKQHLGCASPTK